MWDNIDGIRMSGISFFGISLLGDEFVWDKDVETLDSLNWSNITHSFTTLSPIVMYVIQYSKHLQ